MNSHDVVETEPEAERVNLLRFRSFLIEMPGFHQRKISGYEKERDDLLQYIRDLKLQMERDGIGEQFDDTELQKAIATKQGQIDIETRCLERANEKLKLVELIGILKLDGVFIDLVELCKRAKKLASPKLLELFGEALVDFMGQHAAEQLPEYLAVKKLPNVDVLRLKMLNGCKNEYDDRILTLLGLRKSSDATPPSSGPA